MVLCNRNTNAQQISVTLGRSLKSTTCIAKGFGLLQFTKQHPSTTDCSVMANVSVSQITNTDVAICRTWIVSASLQNSIAGLNF